jgi:hypothetical protein
MLHAQRVILFATTVSLMLICTLPVAADDWSRFRGANGSGISKSTGLPVEFGPGNSMLWEASVPFGRSSPVIAGDRIFVTAVEDDKLLTLALDRKSGEVVWRRALKRGHVAELYKATDSTSTFSFMSPGWSRMTMPEKSAGGYPSVRSVVTMGSPPRR